MEAAGRELPATAGKKEKTVLFESPLRLLLLMAAAVFLGETVVMLVLDHLVHLSRRSEAILDSTILIVILSPTFYFLWFRPFRHHLAERRRSEAETRRLSRQLLQAAEEERKKLSRDVHDEFGQAVTALQLDIESLQRECPVADPRHAAIGGILERSRTLNDRLRHFSSALRPQMLDDMGIVPTLQCHLREYLKSVPQLQVQFQAVGLKKRLPPPVEIVLYRICQEALNNIVKHADARIVGICLTYCHPKILLTIRDDGTGFEIAGAAGRGIGLLGMRERAASIGGSLQVASSAGRGTVIRAELPVPWG